MAIIFLIRYRINIKNNVIISEVLMIIVFDTNIWILDLALTSNVGSAVRFYLREQKGRIGLPEVVKLETEFHLRTTLADHIEGIRSSHRQLLTNKCFEPTRSKQCAS